ncbi:MAG: quinolinate synthase NadA [Armatimonadetes bacterium]|nr:quinolinate synthase NadA [Armatimonadota bacterium]
MATLTLGALARQAHRTPVQEPLPDFYFQASAEETQAAIGVARAALRDRLVILGHHYQRDEIIRWADYTGDSFKLSQLAAARSEADFILFCGVHFMAESADILSANHQRVILPNMTAGCSMADMADIYQVRDCWDQLTGLLDEKILPITYMNSAANLKAFVGERGGTVCTSSNAPAALRWAFTQAPKVLFFPDQHLGRNTGARMGIPLEEMVLWDPFEQGGGPDCAGDALRRAKIILWKGHCSVHGRFTLEQIRQARAHYPDVNVIVHPECTLDVVQAADDVGSTEHIVKVIGAAPSGTKWAVGTEINLVNRLAKQHPDKLIFCLDPVVCPCSTMYRIHPAYLRWALDNLVAGRVVNQVTVPPEIRHWAHVALDRMLAVH